VRIIIDIQCIGTASRYRGIGNYSIALVKKILELNNEHDIFLLINNNSEEVISIIKTEFVGLIEEDKIKAFHCFANANEMLQANLPYIMVSEKIRNHVIDSLNPDFVLVTSLFEGGNEDFICSIDKKRSYKIGVIGYDLIPLMNVDLHLPTQASKSWYFRKFESLKNSDYIFSISESAKTEFKNYLSISDAELLNISSACDDLYHKVSSDSNSMLSDFPITREFVLYSGACDERKNLKGLLNAFAKLKSEIRKKYQIVLVGKYPDTGKQELDALAAKLHLESDTIIYTGFITNESLKNLYKKCRVFVFPSFHEGFGLPVLEAMTCGAPTICSNTSSLPEVIGIEDAMFDPYDIDDINQKLLSALEDDDFRALLTANAQERANHFSWKDSAERLLTFVNDNVTPRTEFLNYTDNYKLFVDELPELISKYSLDNNTLKYIAKCIVANQNECKVILKLNSM
tara:strand:+ start:1627 stop:3000 length:1374 start_codon:yes stop_codon:yes gene_type:complete